MKIEKSYWNLIVKFYTDELSKEESIALDKWKSESNDNLQFFEQFKNILNATDDSFVNIETNEDELWHKLQQRIDEENENKKVIDFKSYFIKISVAASVLLCLVIGSNFFFNNKSEELEFITIQTNSKPQNIHLSDSSWVCLAKNTSFKYSRNFKSNRNTKLDGEAYFIIAKDTLNPFIIHAKSTITKVVGTEFNIKTDEENVEIEVIEGIVEFGDAENIKHTRLVKGESAQYNKKAKILEKNIEPSKKKIKPDWFKNLKKKINIKVKQLKK